MNFDECHRAIKKSDILSLRQAIQAKEFDPNLHNRFSWTLLMLAALEGNIAIGELLLQSAASVNAKNDFGELQCLWRLTRGMYRLSKCCCPLVRHPMCVPTALNLGIG